MTLLNPGGNHVFKDGDMTEEFNINRHLIYYK